MSDGGNALEISKLRAFLLVPLMALAVWTTDSAASAVLVDPPAIAVPPGLTDMVVAKAIRVGAAQRGWVVERKDASYMEATLHLRTHVAKVGITYDTNLVHVRYLASENLDYALKDGVPRIHGNYLKWVNNLVRDISVQLVGAITE